MGVCSWIFNLFGGFEWNIFVVFVRIVGYKCEGDGVKF